MKAWAKIAAGTGTFLIADLIAFKIFEESEALTKWLDAQNYCSSVGKQLLNIGCGNNPRFIGDVNVDIRQSILPNSVIYDLNLPLPYGDKQFGACVAFHILEHLDNPKNVLSEMSRVADRAYIAIPSYLNLISLVLPTHKWVFFNSDFCSLAPFKAMLGSALIMAAGASLIYCSVKKR